jgi:hypothetical protein
MQGFGIQHFRLDALHSEVHPKCRAYGAPWPVLARSAPRAIRFSLYEGAHYDYLARP